MHKNNLLKNSSIITLSELNHVKSCINIFQNKGKTPTAKRKFDELFITNSIMLKNKIINYDNIHGINGIKRVEDDYEEKQNKKILLKAIRYKDENLDEVKTMNSLLLSAKFATIRDKQIEEKRKLNLFKKKIEQKEYLIGEYERLKDEINRARSEKKLKEKKMNDRKEIEKQILNNLKIKEEHKKLIEKEYEENMRYQEQIKLDEINKAKIEKEKREKLIQEMIEANKNVLEIKKNKKLQELKEEQDLKKYNEQKLIEEQNKQKELNELKHLKDMQFAKLVNIQKNLINNNSILEDIYTRRSYEEGIRAERKKMKDELIKNNKLKEEMKLENQKLIEYRNKINMEQTCKMDKEYKEIIKKYKLEIEKEKEKEKKAIEYMLKYKEDLLKMIAIKDEEKKLKRREIIDEGKKLKKSQDEYYKRLQSIKSRKIEELNNLNVPQKYITNLEKFRIKKIF